MLLTANWREWYHFRHQQECLKSGSAFEDYVTRVLSRFHDDFVNPTASGRLGDGGCDGLAESGTLFYACYGQRPGRNAERELTAKINSDFTRGLSQWNIFHTWRFVTNAPIGPTSLAALTALQQNYGPATERPLTILAVNPEELWIQVVSTMDVTILNQIFPGAPGAENVDLADLLPLLDALGTAGSTTETGGEILPIPVSKMDFNELPVASRLEFNAGRHLAPRINRWYEESSDPGLSDEHGDKFRSLYLLARLVTTVPAEILERLYVSVAGANFRMDGKRANASFAVTSYFFDSCHIFEAPPIGSTTEGFEVSDAPAN